MTIKAIKELDGKRTLSAIMLSLLSRFSKKDLTFNPLSLGAYAMIALKTQHIYYERATRFITVHLTLLTGTFGRNTSKLRRYGDFDR